MKLKRFTAPDIRQALQLVRQELGPDAVIVSNRRSDAGVAVVAAVDYEAAASDTVEDHPVRAPVPVERPARPEPSAYAGALSMDDDVAWPGARPVPGDAVAVMQGELARMRELLEDQLSSLAWNEMGRSRPLRAAVLRELSAMGVDAGLAREVADQLPDAGSTADAERLAAQGLVRRVPVLKDDLIENGGVVAVVGATGVGKTTTVAKLAARYVMRHGPHDVCLLSTDTYRIGAREQLLSYARILGVPLHVAANRDDLAALLAAQSRRRLVLIDTAGMSQRDLRLPEQFGLLRSQGTRTRILLALSAASDHETLDELVETYAAVAPAACVLTKLDEAASFGPAISVLARRGLPLAWCANGQRVPEDIHPAYNKRMWLVATAVSLARRRPPALDEGVLARRFREAAVHA
ncbi:MAG: flagellar biosynthesis protein FlhF [Steroidobacteraceae bacterium]